MRRKAERQSGAKALNPKSEIEMAGMRQAVGAETI
jgi:hypothetical protein